MATAKDEAGEVSGEEYLPTIHPWDLPYMLQDFCLWIEHVEARLVRLEETIRRRHDD